MHTHDVSKIVLQERGTDVPKIGLHERGINAEDTAAKMARPTM